MTQGEEARPTAVPGGGIGPEEALKVSEALEEVIASAWDGVSPDDPIAQPLPPDAYDGAWPRRDGERRVDWTRYAPLPKSDLYHRGALVDEATEFAFAAANDARDSGVPPPPVLRLAFRQNRRVVQICVELLDTAAAADGGDGATTRTLGRKDVELRVRPRALSLSIVLGDGGATRATIDERLEYAVDPDASCWSFEELQGDAAGGRYVLIELEKKEDFCNWEMVFVADEDDEEDEGRQ